MLTLRGLTKKFPGKASPAIEGIDLEIRNGEILGLVGLNGAGKTTTIRVCVGLALPTSGSVDVDGRDIVHDKARASQLVGWVPELFPYELSAKALPLLVYFAGFSGLRGSAARSQARELLARVGLASVERDRIRTFSQGMKKRFGLAAVMLSEPRNLLLDEILNGLDPEGIAFVRNWSLEQKRLGNAVLLSSHILAELEAMADRVAFVHNGHLLRIINRAELARAAGTLLRITIENLDAAAVVYLGSLGTARVEGTTVLLADPQLGPSEINAELGRRGYRVSELRLEGTSLEAYFFQLLGAAQ